MYQNFDQEPEERVYEYRCLHCGEARSYFGVWCYCGSTNVVRVDITPEKKSVNDFNEEFLLNAH